MDARTRDQHTELVIPEHRYLRTPEAATHLPGHLSCPAPRSHLLRRTRRNPRRRAHSLTQSADGVGPSAARRQSANRPVNQVLQGSTRFYEVLRGTTRFYEVLQGSTRFYEVRSRAR